MKYIFLALLAIITGNLPLRSQSTDEVMVPVKQLFQAMQTKDSMLAASVFTEDALLHTIYTDTMGITQKRSLPANRLAAAFGNNSGEVWSEPIWNEKIEVDGNLASVWVNYAFYIGNTFSHCGVDAFHLVKTNKGWKIFHLADTRQQKDCNVPTSVRSVYEH
jgi:hypothetical protein